MLRALVVVGIENLLKLGVGNTDVGFTTQENIDAYQNSLVRNLDTALDKVVDDVIGFENQNVTKAAFVENLQKPENAQILTSYGFRQYIMASSLLSKGEVNMTETNIE